MGTAVVSIWLQTCGPVETQCAGWVDGAIRFCASKTELGAMTDGLGIQSNNYISHDRGKWTGWASTADTWTVTRQSREGPGPMWGDYRRPKMAEKQQNESRIPGWGDTERAPPPSLALAFIGVLARGNWWLTLELPGITVCSGRFNSYSLH